MTDPALRAQEVPKCRATVALCDLPAGHSDRHAAAEAAPLDARTMTNAWAVLVAETNPNRWEPDRYNAAAFVTALLAEYAALRSPDTEETT